MFLLLVGLTHAVVTTADVRVGAAVGASAQAPAAAGPSAIDTGLAALYERLETVLRSGDRTAFTALASASPEAGEALSQFAAQEIHSGVTRAVVRERDRDVLLNVPAGEGFRVMLEAFLEVGPRASVRTWRLDVRPVTRATGISATPGVREWAVTAAERLTFVDGLHRLTLNRAKQYRVANLTVSAEDLTLTVPNGTAFVAETADGPTAVVVLGDGQMVFSPKPAAERGQVRLLTGEDVLRTSFSGVFVRLNPWDMRDRFSSGSMTEEAVRSRDLRRAEAIFERHVARSFGLELGDLSREEWSLIPPQSDFLAEIDTSRFDTLTYTRSSNEPEDISLFDRAKRRNLSIYASERKLATRGPFYSEDDEADYDVEAYAIQTHFDPGREWIDGHTNLRVRVRSYTMSMLTLRLAEALVVRSVTSPGLGRLLTLRVKGQNSIIVNLPRSIQRDGLLELAVTYSGRLPGIVPEREVLALQQEQAIVREEFVLAPEPRIVYTHRSHWYPQSTVTDYATGTLHLTVPTSVACVATGAPASGNPLRIEGARPNEARHRYVFEVTRPARYFSAVISRLTPITASTLQAPSAGSNGHGGANLGSSSLQIETRANPRQEGRGRAFHPQAGAILSTYAAIVGDFPYPTFTLAVVDDPLPGGHSPAYFALVHQPLPTSPYSWRNDPVAFDSYPQFFLAHELAHQYWGDAVGGENYHEQWISEGFSQYFAVLYAERTRSREDVASVFRQLRRTAASSAKHGPVWLGYRLGHVQGDSRIFRALVYNKGALILHMLRRQLGDDVFFRGVQRLYRESRFTKIGTGDVQRAFEAEAGGPLERFFKQWILGSNTPELRVSYRVEPAGSAGAATNGGQSRPVLVVRFEQVGEAFEVPVTLTVTDAAGRSTDTLVRITEAVIEHRQPVDAPPRAVAVNADDQALVEVRMSGSGGR